MSGQLTTLKLAAQVVASFGVTKVINDVITNNTTIQTTADAVKVWSGSLVIGSMVVDQAAKHIGDRVDQAADWYASRKTETPA